MPAKEMPKTYDPEATESRLYEWWESRGYFRPETQFALGQASREQKPFVISMPPPNITGALHLGQAMTAAIEDLMIRYHRMRGEPTLWVPGADHAGIAKSTTDASPNSIVGWASPVTGNGSASPWTMGCPAPCAPPSSGSTRRTSSTAASIW